LNMYDSYIKNVCNLCEMEDEYIFLSNFVQKLISNEFYAMGFKYGEYRSERINPEFWEYFSKMSERGRLDDIVEIDYINERIVRRCRDGVSIIYENVLVFESPYLGKMNGIYSSEIPIHWLALIPDDLFPDWLATVQKEGTWQGLKEIEVGQFLSAAREQAKRDFAGKVLFKPATFAKNWKPGPLTPETLRRMIQTRGTAYAKLREAAERLGSGNALGNLDR